MSALLPTRLLDWLLKRKRCPFCVAPYPQLRCIALGQWLCPRCESEFAVDAEGDLESYLDGSHSSNAREPCSKHFPTASATASSTILCPSCALNQQKIVQCLQAFEPSASASTANARRQYELFSEKLDGRYPLCATCSYRVSMQLKACQDRALQYQRHTLLVPKLDTSGAAGRAKLAEELHSRTGKMVLLKNLFFFYPEILVQGTLVLLCLFKKEYHVDGMLLREWRLELDTRLVALRLWIPAVWSHCSSLWYHIHIVFTSLFLIQFHGIAVNSRGLHALVLQAFLLSTRVAVANSLAILYSEAPRPSKVLSLALAAMGLAVTCAVGSQNGRVRRMQAKKRSKASERSAPVVQSSMSFADFTGAQPSKMLPQIAAKDGGFSKYSDSQYRYHSFANVGGNTIKPYSIKPLPGNMTVPMRRFDPNTHNLAGVRQTSAMRPTVLDVSDSLGLEPMFSSFNLSDSSHDATGADKENAPTPLAQLSRRQISGSDKAVKLERNVSCPRVSVSVTKPVRSTRLETLSWYMIYNVLVTMSLLGCRCLVQGRASLEAVVLAASFGLRGFFWSRLALWPQLVLIAVALARLALLAAQITERIVAGNRVLWPALLVDLVLIGLR